MNRGPAVSVVMGVYNAASTLGAAIESVQAQTCRDWEFIILDDGSADGSAAIAEAFAAADPRIIVARNDRNRGLAYTLNRGLADARGRYLARMDADDVSRPERLASQLAWLEAHPDYGYCGCSLALFDDCGVWGNNNYSAFPDRRSFLWRSPYAHPTVVFRTAVLRAAGGYDEDPRVGRSEDYDLFMRLEAAGIRGGNLTDYLYEYREDRAAFRKRRFVYALAETRVRWRGFKRLGLLPAGLAQVFKPVVIGLLPQAWYRDVRRKLFGIKAPKPAAGAERS